jgi:hypothetical protein
VKKIFYTVLFSACCFGGYWIWNQSSFSQSLSSWVDSGQFLTLEVKLTPDQIIAQNQKNLLKSANHKFLPAKLIYHPHLLLDVKYTDRDKKTHESSLIWGMTSGEMVLDTENWKTTHGFEDCLSAGASERDYLAINALARNSGVLDRSKLMKDLGLDEKALDKLMESVIGKKLVTRSGNQYRLHFASPKLYVTPETAIRQSIVTKSCKHTTRASRRFSERQIEKNAIATFGTDFAIRSVKEIYLPVYQLDVQNPDGSVMTTYWNGISGEQMDFTSITR